MQDIDFHGALNPEQRAAATAPDGPLLVLAAAGTGKTRTLVYRVAFLVRRGIGAERLLLLTFTNRAAREMLERAKGLVGATVGGLWAGTFHHMANRMLRRHAAQIGFRADYAILDREDSCSLIRRSLKERKLAGREFPAPGVLMALFSEAANRREKLGDLLDRRFGEWNGEREGVLAVHRDYERAKQNTGAMDFDDLLLNCLRLFDEQPAVLARYQEQFLHVLVDEYQDTNLIQADLVDRIGAQHRNVLVVGDDFQSIYAWRGADYRNIMTFPDRYRDAAIHRLETNYRSVPEILQVANACIAGNPRQFRKTLRATREAHRKPVLAKIRDGGEQGRFVADFVRALRREGYRYADIAVLYRAHFHSMELQMELTHEGMPFVIVSGTRFFEQAHIKDVCSVLRILACPRDELAFARLLGLLPGVGEKTALRAWQKLDGAFDASDPSQRERLRALLPAAAREQWMKVEPVLAAYRDEQLREDGGEVLHRFLKNFYEAHASRAFENHERRVEDIHELILYTGRFETVDAFLSDVALLTNLDAEAETTAHAQADALRLSTVHQAKGLEWPVVIVIWATDNMFPSPRALKEDAEAEAEERRLFYVAVTRAKDELCLCVPEVRRTREGGVIFCQPSRFVTEIPPALLREVRPALV